MVSSRNPSPNAPWVEQINVNPLVGGGDAMTSIRWVEADMAYPYECLHTIRAPSWVLYQKGRPARWVLRRGESYLDTSSKEWLPSSHSRSSISVFSANLGPVSDRRSFDIKRLDPDVLREIGLAGAMELEPVAKLMLKRWREVSRDRHRLRAR